MARGKRNDEVPAIDEICRDKKGAGALLNH